MEEKGEFYLLRAVDEKGKYFFAQKLSSNSTSYLPSLTYHAEYAIRCETYEEIKKIEKQIKLCGNNVSKIEFKVVKYLMPKEQLSWSPPKDYIFSDYEDLLKGKGYE